MIVFRNNKIVNFYKDYPVIGMLQAIADFVNRNIVPEMLQEYKSEKNENEDIFDFFVIQENQFTEESVDEEVVRFFAQIVKEVKTVWSNKKQTFDIDAGFTLFNDLYFEEFNKEDLSPEELEVYQKYCNDFADRIVLVKKDKRENGDIEYSIVFERRSLI